MKVVEALPEQAGRVRGDGMSVAGRADGGVEVMARREHFLAEALQWAKLTVEAPPACVPPVARALGDHGAPGGVLSCGGVGEGDRGG